MGKLIPWPADYATRPERAIEEQRAEILAAFLAKYGLEPDEVEQITHQIDQSTSVFYVRRADRPSL